MPYQGVLDAGGGQVIADLSFAGSGTGLDAKRWTNTTGDTGFVARLDTGRMDLITGAANDRHCLIWQTQQIRPANIGVLTLVALGVNTSATVFFRATSTTRQANLPLPNSSYGVRFNNGFLDLLKCAGATFSAVTTVSGLPFAGIPRFWMRCEAVGNIVRAKVWGEGTQEPGWQINLTDTSNLAPGTLGIAGGSNAAAIQECFVHSFTAYIPESSSASLLPIILQGSTASTATATTVAAVAAVPSVSLVSSPTVTPTEVVAVAAVPAVTVTATAAVTPSSVAALAAVGAPTSTATAVLATSSVPAVAAVPAPTVNISGSDVTLLIAVVQAIATVNPVSFAVPARWIRGSRRR